MPVKYNISTSASPQHKQPSQFLHLNIVVYNMLYKYVNVYDKMTWGGWSWECLNDWGQYLKFSIPGLFITIAESGSYEVGMLVVSMQYYSTMHFWLESG